MGYERKMFHKVCYCCVERRNSLKEASRSSTISIIGEKYNIPEPYSGLYNSYTTEYIKGILNKYEENKEVK